MAVSIALGPFDLQHPLGVGGMGEVWSAVHRVQRTPVAVKVLTSHFAREPVFIRAFRNEVRATAALDHPSIVTVLDYGTITPEAETTSQGRLQAGSPYLVMERVLGGSLQDVLGTHPWDDLRRDLLRVLDALAHAHARGVVHRDLKPANVLRGPDGSLRLTDFGIAHAVERQPSFDALEDVTTGTPRYMAPEQFEGRWRDYGPWTDLYSLGCCAFALAAGAPPFSGSMAELKDLHLHAPVPDLGPRVPVARGYEEWIRRLLQKDPAHRYQRAADAAWGLFRLGEARASVVPDLPPSRAERAPEPETVGMTLTFVDDRTNPGGRSAWPPAPPEGDAEDRPITIPPLPSRWHRPDERTRSRAFVAGVGLGLYGMRQIPLVDREPERDALWRALHEVRSRRTARAVVLRGPAGCGKTRLAEWLGERAHELGAAHVLRATHAPMPGPLDGLAAMLARSLRAQGLPHRDAVIRISEVLRPLGCADSDEWLALGELIAPAEGESGPRVRFQTATERHALVHRHLARLGADRCVVVWLDDVQWGLESLELCRHILAEAATGAPILVLLTAAEEALAERAAEVQVLAGLLGRPDVADIEVGPLPREHRAALVTELLGLEGELAARVEERTAGNALFAVQLVGDWVQRGLLEPTEAGFRLRPGATVELPENVQAIWDDRMGRMLAKRPVEDAVALEIAATLGQEVDALEWAEACTEAGVIAPFELVEELIARRLARALPEGADIGWGWVHAMLREALERRAETAGRAPAHHRACASMLALRTGPGICERIARHLLASGDVESALAPLLEGARERLTAGDYRQAEVLLRDREQAMSAIGLPDRDVAWGDGWVLRARAAHAQGRLDDAVADLVRVEEDGWRWGWTRARIEARIERSLIARLRGDLDGAVALAEEAQRLARAANDEALLARALLAAADSQRSRALLDDATRSYEAAEPMLRSAANLDGLGWCHLGLALVARQRGDHATTERHGRIARASFGECGARRGVALAANLLGEPARFRGDLAGAEALYHEALTIFGAIGAFEAVIPEINLGHIHLARQRWGDARVHLERAAVLCARNDNKLYAGPIAAFLLPCAAADGDWSEWDDLLAQLRTLIAETGVADVDLPEALQVAAALADQAGEADRASAAREIAAAQLRALGH